MTKKITKNIKMTKNIDNTEVFHHNRSRNRVWPIFSLRVFTDAFKLLIEKWVKNDAASKKWRN